MVKPTVICIPFSQILRLAYPVVAVVLLLAASCARNKPYQIGLMPAPEIYASGTIDPFREDFSGRGIVFNDGNANAHNIFLHQMQPVENR